MSDRPVAVLCGGLGTRLGYPGQKCLVPVAGRPFLHWKLDQLVKHGATEIHLLANIHEMDEMNDSVWRWSFGGFKEVEFHWDDHAGQRQAHAWAAKHMPFIHWLTYGDGLLDVPLSLSSMPYRWVNDEFPDDAGVGMCWGQSFRWHRKHTDAVAYHINTPEDLARTEAHLANLH